MQSFLNSPPSALSLTSFNYVRICIAGNVTICRKFVLKVTHRVTQCRFWQWWWGRSKRVKLHQRAKFLWNRLNRGRDMAIFRFIEMAAAAILDFENLKFSTVGSVKRVELHHPAKFHPNRPNRGWIMAIFRFFKMAGDAMLDFENFNGRGVQEGRTASSCPISSKLLKPRLRLTIFQLFQDGGRPPSWICNAWVGTSHEGYLVVVITVQNLVVIDAVVFIICTFFDFESLDWKCLFTPQN